MVASRRLLELLVNHGPEVREDLVLSLGPLFPVECRQCMPKDTPQAVSTHVKPYGKRVAHLSSAL